MFKALASSYMCCHGSEDLVEFFVAGFLDERLDYEDELPDLEGSRCDIRD